MVSNKAVTPDGTTVTIIASAGDEPRKENLPKASNELRIASASWFKKKYACGHRGPRRFTLFVYGITAYPTDANHQCPNCCIKEIKRMVIRCASCELPIFPGDGVALYHPTTEGLNLAVANFVGPEAVVCCLRFDCCTHPELFAGHWSEKGFKQFSFEDHD